MNAPTVTLSGPGPVPGPALHLLGLALPDGAGAAGPITIDGALDSAGRAFAIRNATAAAKKTLAAKNARPLGLAAGAPG